jgi:hypothetical protein
MPDDDRIPTSLTAPWKKVLRYLRSGRSAEDTTDAVTAAMAATLRDVHGVPGLPDIARRMQEAAASGAVEHSRVPGSAGARQHVPTDVAERAAAGFAATMRSELALVSPGTAALMLAKRVIAGLAYHYGLDRIGPLLAAEGAYTTRELQDLFADILASEQVSKLAKRLLARPTGQESQLRDCLAQQDPWSALVLEFPEVLDTAPLTPMEVVGLYRSYVQEWEDLPEAFRPQNGRAAAL